MIVYRLLICINLGALCLLLGGMAEVALVEIPLFRRLSHERFVEVHGILDRHMDRYMPAVTGLAVLTGLGELFLGQYGWQTVSIAIGTLCLVAVALISHLVNVPLNRRIRSWQESTSTNLLTLKNTWIRSHYVRTCVGLMSFLLLIIPLILQITHA